MKVIIASHQKTGTKTLHEALEILGYNVYDFVENFFLLGDKWQKIFDGKGTTDDFKEMFENVDAVCDQPCLLYWEEIHKAFPEAKIIIMPRDEDSWYKSLLGQVAANESNYMLRVIMLLSPTSWRVMRLGVKAAKLSFGMSGNPFSMKFNEMYAKLCYRRHNAHVYQNSPKDKLLVFNMKDGWEPLCQFLDKEMPSVPFPHKNKGGNIFDELLASHGVFQKLKKEAMFVSFGIILSLVCIGIIIMSVLMST